MAWGIDRERGVVAMMPPLHLLTAVPPPSPRGPQPGKPATRRMLLALRDAMSAAERATASDAIGRAALALVAEDVRTVALYAAKGSEVATASLDQWLRERGVRVAYPRVVGEDRKLVFHEVAALDELVLARFGLREPAASAPVVSAPAIDVFFVPGLAFDREGARVGWGRGHYDATLVDAPDALLVGLAFACQMVERIDRDPHDVLLDYVVTEVATHEMT